MQNQPRRELNPLFAGNEGLGFRSDFLGIFEPGQPESARKASNMGIHGHARSNAEALTENNFGGLASDSREFDELIHIGWNPLAVVHGNHPGRCNQ